MPRHAIVAEDAIREMAGTAWVDEQDRMLARVLRGYRFVNSFKVGAGLLVDIKKDTRFSFQQTRVNGEVWLPARIDAQGSARALLFFNFSGQIQVVDSQYRKSPGDFHHPSGALAFQIRPADAPWRGSKSLTAMHFQVKTHYLVTAKRDSRNCPSR